MKYDEEILRDLVKIYEKRDANSSNFKTKIKIVLKKNKYPKYFEDEEGYNEAIKRLENKKYIMVNILRHDTVIESISLNIDLIENIKKELGIYSVSDRRQKLLEELEKYDDKILINLKKEIEDKIRNNKSIKQYLNPGYIDAIKAVHYLENLDHLVYERNASNYLFNDSKRLGKIRGIIASIYNNDDIFYEKGILQFNPYLYVKGDGIICINNECLDLSKINTSIGIPIDNIALIEFEKIQKVTTIENLTTFYDYKDDGLIIYLGGFSSSSQIECLKKIKECTRNFYHFGDIDFGGFTILNNLMEQLNINIKAINMDVQTLKKYSQYTQAFDDEEYVKKLKSLLDKPFLKPFYSTIEYLIENKIWLEQEAFYNS